jgi:hypothetical protein
MNEEIVCKRCGLMNDYRVEVSGPHQKAICNGCDQYIKFLPQIKGEFADHSIMWFGKHKNKMLGDIPTDYFRWCLENLSHINHKLERYMKNRIENGQ